MSSISHRYINNLWLIITYISRNTLGQQLTNGEKTTCWGTFQKHLPVAPTCNPVSYKQRGTLRWLSHRRTILEVYYHPYIPQHGVSSWRTTCYLHHLSLNRLRPAADKKYHSTCLWISHDHPVTDRIFCCWCWCRCSLPWLRGVKNKEMLILTCWN